MSIETVNVYLYALIIAGGVLRVVWLLFMLILSDTPPYKMHEIKNRIRNTLLALAVAASIGGIVAFVRTYF